MVPNVPYIKLGEILEWLELIFYQLFPNTSTTIGVDGSLYTIAIAFVCHNQIRERHHGTRQGCILWLNP